MRAIVCADANWGIGSAGDLQVHISADLKRFKALTMGCPVILGRKTLSTFPGGRPLPGRENLVLSRNPDFAPEGVQVFARVEDLLAVAPETAWLIGGGELYRQLLPHCTQVEVTRLDATLPADTWFPDLDAHPEWEKTHREGGFAHEGLTYYFDTYHRISGGTP